MADEPVCAMVRHGHPLLRLVETTYYDVAKAPWIVPPLGSILSHKFDLVFKEAGFDCPKQIIETASPIIMTRVLEETDFIAVAPCDVTQYYASCGLIEMLPIKLSCTMEAFGVITRKDWLLSPAAEIMLSALTSTAESVYGTRPN